MCNTRNQFPYAINCDRFAWCGSLLWLYKYCLFGTTHNTCDKKDGGAILSFLPNLWNTPNEALITRAMEPQPKKFLMAGAGVQIWVPVPQFVGQASCTISTMLFSFQWTKSFSSKRQKNLDAQSCSPSLKFGFRLHSLAYNSILDFDTL